MLGLGTRLFISPETTYGVEDPTNYTVGASATVGHDFANMNTYYIQNDRISTSFNQDEVDYMSSNRGRYNVFHKNVNNIEGSFTFNLQSNMLKLFKTIMNDHFLVPDPVTNPTKLLSKQTNIDYVASEDLDVDNISNKIYYGHPSNQDIIVKRTTTEEDLKSMTIIHTLSDNSKHYKFYGVCIDSMDLNVTSDSAVVFTLNFLGQREELIADPLGDGETYFEVIDNCAGIYPSWGVGLQFDLWDDGSYGWSDSWQDLSYKDFNLEINNNLEFANFLTSERYPVSKPFQTKREINGSFTIDYDSDATGTTFFNYINDLDSGIRLKLSFTDPDTVDDEFEIIFNNIVFTSGGSLENLPEGMLELSLEFSVVDEIFTINETENYTLLAGKTTVATTEPNTEITFSIKEG